MVFTQKVKSTMTDFIIKKLPYDLSSHAGLAFIGKYLKSIKINSLIDSAFPVRSGTPIKGTPTLVASFSPRQERPGGQITIQDMPIAGEK
jgi:hypothetical protein